ncbi:conserved hypothetical protein, partial [Ricinus communis]
PQWAQADAAAGRQRVTYRQRVVDAVASARLHDFCLFAIMQCEQIAVCQPGEADVVVPCHILRPPWLAATAQIGWRCHQLAWRCSRQPGNGVWRQVAALPHGDVHALLDQVDHAVVQYQFDVYLRVARQEWREHGIEAELAEGGRRVQADQARRRFGLAARFRHRFLIFGQHAKRALIEAHALRRGLQTGGAAFQQAHAEFLFQRGDDFADGRLCRALLACNGRQAA